MTHNDDTPKITLNIEPDTGKRPSKKPGKSLKAAKAAPKPSKTSSGKSAASGKTSAKPAGKADKAVKAPKAPKAPKPPKEKKQRASVSGVTSVNRIEQNGARFTPGYQVKYRPAPGKLVTKWFGEKRYGTDAKAKAAATAWLEEQKKANS